MAKIDASEQLAERTHVNSKIRLRRDLAITFTEVPSSSDFRDRSFPCLYLSQGGKFEHFCEKLINGKLIDQNQQETKN